MRWLLIGTMVTLMFVLAVGHAGAADDSQVKSGCSVPETKVQLLSDMTLTRVDRMDSYRSEQFTTWRRST